MDITPLPSARPLYLDYQATTPVNPQVLEAMLPYFGERFGNPHARGHRFGWEAEAGLEQAREQVAALIGASPKELIFTSGATEANNLAIKGVAMASSSRQHVVTVATEHVCVLNSVRTLERNGFAVTVLPVMRNGLIDLNRLRDIVSEDTLLVSVMAVNNEIGVLQPLAEIGAICRNKGALFHTDAAQGFGKIPLDVEQMGIDLLSLSGHKAYAPQGVGALYVRRRPKVMLEPLFDGGGQERGIRPGTVPVALTVGLGKAAVLAGENLQSERERLQGLYELFLSRTLDRLDGVSLHGDRVQRWPGNVNLGFDRVDNGSMLLALKALAVSAGSACASGSGEPSYVLEAIGTAPNLAQSAIRFGFGKPTTQQDVEFAAQCVVEALTQLRKKRA